VIAADEAKLRAERITIRRSASVSQNVLLDPTEKAKIIAKKSFTLRPMHKAESTSDDRFASSKF